MNRIRELRKSRGMTMKQLGQMVGKTEACICQYETGLRVPPVPVAKCIAKSLGCNWKKLYDDDGG